MRSRARCSTAIGLLLLALLAALTGGAAAQAAGRGATRRYAFTQSSRAIVPVLVETDGSTLAGRVTSARVRIYAVPPRAAGRGSRGASGRRATGRGTAAAAKPRLIGSARTGRRGIALVRLRGRTAPRALLVTATSGRTFGRSFGGRLMARVRYRAPHAVYVTPLSTLVAREQLAHPRRSLATSRARVRALLQLPRFFDFAGDLADRSLFDGRRFLRAARAAGGFDRYTTRLARQLARRPRGRVRPNAKATASPVASASGTSGACWNASAQTTAGFADFLGFGGVPDPPAIACPAASSSATGASASTGAAASARPSASAAAPTARAAGLGPNEIFGDVIGVASFAYSLFSGQGSSATLTAIQGQLNAIQSTLTQIQDELGGLQQQVAAVNTNVTNGNVSGLIGDAAPTINAIKTGASDVNVLVGAAYQVFCAPSGACTSARGYANFGDAVDQVCDTETAACDRFYSLLYVTVRALDDAKPKQAIANLGTWSLGSAYGGGPLSPGIVQYSLQAGAGAQPFFQTEDAAGARLQWAYYTLYATLVQSTYATALSMGVGQKMPGATSKHAPTLTPTNVTNQVSGLNAPIDAFMGAFPNMPDSAVIDVDLEDADSGTPPMFAQEIGGLASFGAFSDGDQYTLSAAAAQSGSLPASNGSGGFLTTLQTGGAAPVVITPAAADGDTWQLLPSAGSTRPPAPPSVSSAPFGDWIPASATATSTTPEWDSSTNTISASQGGLSGPLADLYSGAAPASGQTAGQWMTAASGIDSGLLMPASTGYGNTSTYGGFSGVVPYYGQSGTDGSDPGLGITGCTPAGDTDCLLPTWQSVGVNPYDAVSSGQTYNTSGTHQNTGLFDFNNGVVIGNQQGHPINGDPGYTSGSALASNPTAYLNEYPNWTTSQTLRGVAFSGFLAVLDGTLNSGVQQAGFNSAGRPVLFNRLQTGNDCFYWTGATSANPAGGTGCLTQRTASGQILP